MALTRNNPFPRLEGKLLVLVPKPGPESDFHKAAARDSNSKSGSSPIGFNKRGHSPLAWYSRQETLSVGSTSDYSTLKALEGSATKRTQTRGKGAQSQFAKRGKPNPVDVQAAHNNRLLYQTKKQLLRMRGRTRGNGDSSSCTEKCRRIRFATQCGAYVASAKGQELGMMGGWRRAGLRWFKILVSPPHMHILIAFPPDHNPDPPPLLSSQPPSNGVTPAIVVLWIVCSFGVQGQVGVRLERLCATRVQEL